MSNFPSNVDKLKFKVKISESYPFQYHIDIYEYLDKPVDAPLFTFAALLITRITKDHLNRYQAIAMYDAIVTRILDSKLWHIVEANETEPLKHTIFRDNPDGNWAFIKDCFADRPFEGDL